MKAIHFYKDTTCKAKPPFLVVFNLVCYKQYMDHDPKVICKMQISRRLEFTLVCGKNIVENITQELSYLTVLLSNEDANYEIQVLEQAEK